MTHLSVQLFGAFADIICMPRSTLETSHAELRAALILAGGHIRKLNFGRRDESRAANPAASAARRENRGAYRGQQPNECLRSCSPESVAGGGHGRAGVSEYPHSICCALTRGAPVRFHRVHPASAAGLAQRLRPLG